MDETVLNRLKDNLGAIQSRIAAAAARANRDLSAITLVAVTKSVDTEMARLLIEAGARDLGENRVQEGEAKRRILGDRCEWHMIGHLQTNKVKKTLAIFNMIHAVDSERLLREISRRADSDGLRPGVLLEVNVSGEESKYGLRPADVERLASLAGELPAVELRGLMTMAPWNPDPETARPVFRELAAIHRSLKESGRAGPRFDSLSMGMSGDFEPAVEEGATHVRVGTALFEGIERQTTD